MSNKIKNVRAYLQEMAKADVLDMVTPARLAGIKANDPNPVIKVYKVGHEGESKGRIIGVGEVVKKWTRGIVSKLVDVISDGVGLFLGHGVTNDTGGRRRLGEVVGKRLVEEDGKVSALVATYFYPGTNDEAGDLDLCSIETEIDFTVEDGEAIIQDVLPVTGIALGSSSEGMVPGFPEAGLVASLEMFASKAEIQEENMGIEMKDVRAFIVDKGLTPLDLFDDDDILKLEKVTEAIDKKADTKTVKELRDYGNRWKTRAIELETELEKAKEGNLDTMVPKEKYEEVLSKVRTLSAKPTVLSVAKELELSDKERAFLEKRSDRFTPEATDDEAIKEEAIKFVESQRAEFKEVLEIAVPDFKDGEVNVPPDGGGNSGASDNPFMPDAPGKTE